MILSVFDRVLSHKFYPPIVLIIIWLIHSIHRSFRPIYFISSWIIISFILSICIHIFICPISIWYFLHNSQTNLRKFRCLPFTRYTINVTVLKYRDILLSRPGNRVENYRTSIFFFIRNSAKFTALRIHLILSMSLFLIFTLYFALSDSV